MSPSKNVRSIVVGPETWDRLWKLAKKEERSLSELIREALLDLFKKRESTTTYNPETDSYQQRRL